MTINTTTATAAALRPRTLSTQASPFALPAGVWNVPTQRRMRDAVVRPNLGDHNSIPTVGARYGAAKQAAPPRGIPR